MCILASLTQVSATTVEDINVNLISRRKLTLSQAPGYEESVFEVWVAARQRLLVQVIKRAGGLRPLLPLDPSAFLNAVSSHFGRFG